MTIFGFKTEFSMKNKDERNTYEVMVPKNKEIHQKMHISEMIEQPEQNLHLIKAGRINDFSTSRLTDTGKQIIQKVEEHFEKM